MTQFTNENWIHRVIDRYLMTLRNRSDTHLRVLMVLAAAVAVGAVLGHLLDL